MRNLTKIAISQATFGFRRPMSTTFVDLFKGYNVVAYTKIKLQEEEGQNNPTVQQKRTGNNSTRPGPATTRLDLCILPPRLDSS